ncbi:MAG: hypothetical protein KDK60_00890, partial [Chlamydiia bacterium]|nr:hypothetical protein [Chlamydiia bacterium]
MVKKFALLIILSLCIVGCQSKGSYDHVTRFHDDGRAKPVVAFVPVFDRSGAKLGWSLSEEFTE